MLVRAHQKHSLPKRLGIAFASAMATVLGWSASAQVETIDVNFSAPDGCPTQARLRAEIAARSSRVSFAPHTDQGRLFEASVVRQSQGYVGHLVARSQGKVSAVREVHGDQCDEVTSALALMIAFAVDPQASTVPAASLSVTAAPPPSAPSAIAPPAILCPAAPASSTAPTHLPPIPTRWSGEIEWTQAGGAAPSSALGAGLFARALSTSQDGRSAVWRFGVVYTYGPALGDSPKEMTTQVLTARGLGCPFAFASATMSIAPCLQLDLGAIVAEGNQVAHPKTQTRLYSTLGLGLTAQLFLSTSWFLHASSAISTPLVRHTFVFEDPKVIVYQMPIVGWNSSIGIGLSIL